ncbi:MAG: hypothetical protein R3194_02160 [Limnobacter sp.]|nr:hypothetical protein [Limnobacter sp.]
MKQQHRALRVYTYYKIDHNHKDDALIASRKVLAGLSQKQPLHTDLLMRADQTGPEITVMEVMSWPELDAQHESELLAHYYALAEKAFGQFDPKPHRHVELFIAPTTGT